MIAMPSLFVADADPDRDTPRRADEGFSLVEMMTALFIMGLITAGAMLTLGGPRETLGREVDRLAASISGARDAALIRNRAVQVLFSSEGYERKVRTRSGWTALDPSGTATPWVAGSSLQIGESGPEGAIVFDATGLTEGARLTLFRDGRAYDLTVTGDGRILREAVGE